MLQCGSCGGVFYGALTAPAGVEIRKGVLIINQEHGSRFVAEQTFRFRYDPVMNNMVLIGLDLRTRDRVEGKAIRESTNFLTGRKLIVRFKADGTHESTDKEAVAKRKIAIDRIDRDDYVSEDP